MYKVIIVDDEPHIIHGLTSQIDWEAYNMDVIVTATYGQDVLDFLAVQTADLLIADVSMPKMDGLTLISLAKQIQPSLRCIIISAYNEFDFVKKALLMDVENYLLKPINDTELRETLLRSLQNLDQDRTSTSKVSPDVLAFRTNILDRWVQGTIQDFELFERAELLHIHLTAPHYRICLLEMTGTDPVTDWVQSSSLLLELCRIGVALANFQSECFLDASFRVVVIIHGEQLDERRASLDATIHSIVDQAADQGIPAFASIGPLSHSSANVHDSYASALLYLHYRHIDRSSRMISCDCMPLLKRPGFQVGDIPNSLQQLGKAMREGNAQQAELIVRDFRRMLEGQSFEQMKSEVLPIVLKLIPTMIEAGRISKALPEPMIHHLQTFSSITASEQLWSWLAATIREAIHVIHDRKGSYHLLVRHMIEQGLLHYQTELSLKTLAAVYNVSPAYLGQLFKEETGKYFKDFLTEIRLEASRMLLAETSLKISEIIQKIGIPNQSYYNRLFKKTYTLSPMEFRRQASGMTERQH